MVIKTVWAIYKVTLSNYKEISNMFNSAIIPNLKVTPSIDSD